MLTDSITKLELNILDLQTNNEVAAEVGPLRYMSEITGKPMNIIVNWFTLLIVFVFDPLAISMVIALNKLTNKENENGHELYSINHSGDNNNSNDGIPISDTNNEEVLQSKYSSGEPIETNGKSIESKDNPTEEQIKKEKEEVVFVPTDEDVIKNLYRETSVKPKIHRYRK